LLQADQQTSIHPDDILDALRGHPLLEPFRMAVLCDPKGRLDQRARHLCSGGGLRPSCPGTCQDARRQAISSALSSLEPQIFTCQLGLLNFVVPFRDDRDRPCCLLGGGVREKPVSLSQVEALAHTPGSNGLALLDALEKLPFASRDTVEKAAAEIRQLLPGLFGRNLFARALDRTTQRMQALALLAPEFDRAADAEEVAGLLCDAVAVHFDLPRLALLTVPGQRRPLHLARALGLSSEEALPQPGKLADLLERRSPTAAFALAEETPGLFPAAHTDLATCIPLVGGGTLLGLLVAFDLECHPRDLLLIQLLASQAAARLQRLQTLEQHQREASLTARLVELIGTLALAPSRQALYGEIVAMGAELLEAEGGSLMLLDETGEALEIVAAKGMNQTLAKTMAVRVGSSIAGRVARSGSPLLVSDIEKDSRIGIPNRPRFRTKSFLSVPLKINGRIIGVLNLADKLDQGIFTQSDLDLLSSFVDHAGTLIDRASTLERAEVMERLSVTDPLTGLYNRRFLERRLDEELSRSSRQDLQFTVMLLDLDNFKRYNDLCGHLAGDQSLKRVAGLLRTSAREMDILTRYGGEEFCLVLPGTGKSEAVLVAERIRRAIEQEPFAGEAELPGGRLTTSIGLAAFPEDGQSEQDLLHAADLALYQAKHQGRNRLVLYQRTDLTLDAPLQNHG
jgi:diguanylate cyclase (GGDEF)-like protein